MSDRCEAAPGEKPVSMGETAGRRGNSAARHHPASNRVDARRAFVG